MRSPSACFNYFWSGGNVYLLPWCPLRSAHGCFEQFGNIFTFLLLNIICSLRARYGKLISCRGVGRG